MKKCVYCGKGSENKQRTFHRFPNKEKYSQLFEKWIKNMNLDLNIRISKDSRLCSDHFEKKHFYVENKNTYLKSGSVPTIFNKYKSECAICKVKKGTDLRSFHKFPVNNSQLLNKWLSYIKMENFYPTIQDLICSIHFEENCFLRHGQKKTLRLKKNAIPTIFRDVVYTDPNLISNIGNYTLHSLNENTINNNNHSTESYKSFNSLSQNEKITILNMEVNTLHHLENNAIDNNNYDIIDSITSDFSENTNKDNNSTFVTLSQKSTVAEVQQLNLIQSDHNYCSSPKKLREKYLTLKHCYMLKSKALKIRNQRISRLKKKVASLKDILQVWITTTQGHEDKSYNNIL
ncbi:THAP domain-containing protein 5-like isoform X2 [Monomorium pharaonis]|uniref:THAP domain-containing protein 5-like isoform X2 n=1 Tax=Monomorium pharaonis TaxID=307658 RepID=UPI001745DA53|nr:THAP domain-containing protein 5-like isoform X2 [Monomorium pharaonis]